MPRRHMFGHAVFASFIEIWSSLVVLPENLTVAAAKTCFSGGHLYDFLFWSLQNGLSRTKFCERCKDCSEPSCGFGCDKSASSLFNGRTKTWDCEERLFFANGTFCLVWVGHFLRGRSLKGSCNIRVYVPVCVFLCVCVCVCVCPPLSP